MRNYIKVSLLRAVLEQKQNSPPHTKVNVDYEIIGADEDDATEQVNKLCSILSASPSAFTWTFLGGDYSDLWIRLDKDYILRIFYAMQFDFLSDIATTLATDDFTVSGTDTNPQIGTDKLIADKSPRDTWSHGD